MQKIFISSTFRDMQAERDAIHTTVVPELRSMANILSVCSVSSGMVSQVRSRMYSSLNNSFSSFANRI